MTGKIEDLERVLRQPFFDYQVEALRWASHVPGDMARACLYYKTGAGKSLTSLAMLAMWGCKEAVVIAPPSTFQQWQRFGSNLDIEVETMSHAKFRMADTKLSRTKPVIADEMHLFGGHTGKGWKKLDTLGRHLKAPLVLASATPNYNDAERVYCIQHILDPQGTKGGYLDFLYKHCETVANRFSMTPDVTGFRNFADAAEFLAALPGVHYLEDDLVFQIMDVSVPPVSNAAMDKYGYDARRHRIIASIMEEKHVRIFQNLVMVDGYAYPHVTDQLINIMADSDTPVLIFAAHATVATAVAKTFEKLGINAGLVTGSLTTKAKEDQLRRFMLGSFDVLVGTASLATGTDGLDKMCDTLIILDDTEDDAMRRQLIGRIMPRGADTDASKKKVFRVVTQ